MMISCDFKSSSDINLDISSGYWVRMLNSATLSGSGFPYNTNRVYDLNMGANLISFPSIGSFWINEALPNDIDGNIQAIIGEGSSAIPCTDCNLDGSDDDPGWYGTLTQFEGNHGYWIYANEDFSFSYDLGPDDELSREASTTQMTEKPSGLDFIQS